MLHLLLMQLLYLILNMYFISKICNLCVNWVIPLPKWTCNYVLYLVGTYVAKRQRCYINLNTLCWVHDNLMILLIIMDNSYLQTSKSSVFYSERLLWFHQDLKILISWDFTSKKFTIATCVLEVLYIHT